MKGTEKQIAWAEEIRASYIPVAAMIHGAAAIKADTRKTVEVMTDPLRGQSVTIEKYLVDITPKHEAAIARAGHWAVNGTSSLMDDDYRMAASKRLEELACRLDAAIATEDESTYWINRR